MYDQNFKNQVVKECVNGQTIRGTARKYGISDNALRAWLKEYRTRMAVMSNETEGIKVANSATLVDVKESIVELRSININIDGVDITISKQDVEKIMETFHRFDE